MKAALANRLWLFTSRRAAQNFRHASHHVAETQSHILQTYLTRNCNTAYFSNHLPVTNYQSLPLTTYDNYLPYIERVANGEANVLTRDSVQLFELSSGSTAASKMIPYTRTLKSEIGRGLSAWIHNLFTHHADLAAGPAYWSISPLTDGLRRTPAGIPIGFEEDSAYLGALGKWIESALAVPNFVKHIREVETFRYVTLLYLLRCENLRLISVWNPTFLTLLLAPLPQWWDSLLRDIAIGTITPPVNSQLPFINYQSPNKSRAQSLSHIHPTDYASIWKNLSLISCWADGASAPYARTLQEQFPNVIIQPKGLLATEAFVSFPLVGYEGGALAITSHYFEFLSESGNIFLAHQLEKGNSYSVIVTTGGGLYRYQLNDLVEVIGFYNQIPLLKFLGKADRVSDYFGEKLNEKFVANTLSQLFEKHHISPTFYMLAPDDTGIFHYTLYLELPDYPTIRLSDSLPIDLDSLLRQNFHYDFCRKLGQLGETQITLVTRGAETYIVACQSRGQKLGNIKPSTLQKTTGWSEWFTTEESPLPLGVPFGDDKG